MGNDNLKKYEIEAKIKEEASKRTLNESTSSKVVMNNNISIKEAIIETIGHALLNECGAMCVGNNAYEDKTPLRFKNCLELIQQISNLLYQIRDSYSDYNKADDEIKKMLNENYEKVIDILMKKLNDSWNSKETITEVKPKEETQAAEQEIKKDGENIMNQIISLIQAKEEITSPVGEKYIVEHFSPSLSKVRNISTNKSYNVDNEVLLKWKRG